MPICITCSTPVKNLYTTYSKADDRSLGKGVRLTQCPNCKRFADKYVEHDYVVLFIDLVLIKPQVYRHLLFNRLWSPTNKLDPSIIRLGILLVLFDVYITWARIERTNSPSRTATLTSTPAVVSSISEAPIITQYLFFLTLNVVATVVQHGIIRILARVLVKSGTEGRNASLLREGNGGGIDVVYGVGGGSPKSQLNHSRSNSSPSKLKGIGGVQSSNSVVPSISTTTPPVPTLNTNGSSSSTATIPPSSSTIKTSASTTALDDTSVRLSIPPNPNPTPNPTTNQTHTRTNSQNTSTHNPDPKPSHHPLGQPSPSAISTALLVSSCTKLFPILLVIWPTSTSSSSSSDNDVQPASSITPFAHRATSYIGWIVLLNNIEALLILLECGYITATSLAVAGLVGRWVVEGWLLSLVGLVREAEGPVGDVFSLWGFVGGRGG